MAETLTIIGAGVAGLSLGCYAQMNGYRTRIYEMHSLPGGLCTSWRRQGFLADGCIHWLCGSGPGTDLYSIWQELGATQNLHYVNHEVYLQLELPDQTFKLYCDADQMEASWLEMAPEDAAFIHEFAQAVRDFPRLTHEQSPEAGQYLQKWNSLSMDQFLASFQNSRLKRALSHLWGGPMPSFFAILPLAYSNCRSAGYPIGGSLAFAQAIEQRYLDLGGEVHYDARVEKILVENNRAVGLELEDGSQVWERQGDIISAADGYTTIFKMLEGRFVNDRIRSWFEQVPVIPSLVQVTLGVGLPLADAPAATNGLLLVPQTPVVINGKPLGLLNVEVFNFDPTAAPAGKSTLRINLPGNFSAWKQLSQDSQAYCAEKDRVAAEVIAALDVRFPGLAEHVEMIDVATPVTFERYTGNWQGSSQGWVPTPQASAWQQEAAQEGSWPVSKTLPGLSHFFMAGQWVETFGGLPTAAMSARALVETLCQRDGKPFVTTLP